MAAIHFAHSIELRSQPRNVFALLADVSQTPRWLERCTSITLLSPGPLAAGSALRYAYKEGKRSGTMDGQVSLLEPDHRLQMRYHDRVMDVAVDFALEPQGSGTRLTHTIDIVPRSFIIKLFAGIIRKAIPGQTIRDLDKLRALVDDG